MTLGPIRANPAARTGDRRDERTDARINKQNRMIDLVRDGATIKEACAEVGITQQAHNYYVRKFPEYRAQMEIARVRKRELAPLTKHGLYVTNKDDAWIKSFAGFRKHFFDLDTYVHQQQMVDVLDKIKPREIVLINLWPEGGKGLALDTPIPTPSGWTTMGELRVGDQIFAGDGTPTRVTFVSEIHHRPCYSVTFSDGASVIADDQHLWVARSSTPRRTHVATTTELAERVRVSRGADRPNHSVPVPPPLSLPARDLVTDPYVLGVWLGDGETLGARVTTADREVVDEFVAAGYQQGARNGITTNWLGLYGQLRKLGVLGDKHIPFEYLRASSEQRFALLEGLMDSDGHCDERGRCEFTTTKERLALDMAELLRSLGIKFSRFVGRATLNGADCGPKYRFQFMPRRIVFRLPRKARRQRIDIPNDRDRWRTITQIEPRASVPTVCIKVDHPSETFVFGWNMLVTHNSTTLVDWICRTLAFDPNRRITDVSESTGLTRKIVGQVKSRLTDMERYREFISRFGPFYMDGQEKQGKPWTVDYIRVWKASHDERDHSLEARAISSRVYGTRIDDLIVDDIQSRETLAQTKSTYESLRQTYWTRGRKMRTAIVGTRIDNGDVYERMLDDGLIDRHVCLPAVKADGRILCPEWWVDLEEIPGADDEEIYATAEKNLSRIRTQVGEKVWWASYQQNPMSQSLATFTDEMLNDAKDMSRRVGPAKDGGYVVLSLDPALGGGNALTACRHGADRIDVLDQQIDYKLTSTEQIMVVVEEFARRFKPQLLIVERDAMQKHLVNDTRFYALARRHGFQIIPHTTSRNKADAILGVASMASSFITRELTIPWGDQYAHDRMEPLITQLRMWRVDTPSRLLKQDAVMSLWFNWRYWKQNQRAHDVDLSDQFKRTSMPYRPTAYRPLTGVRA